MKKWEKPQLLVLVRSRPEEAILEVCKYYPPAPAGPANDDGCLYEPGLWCDSLVTS